MKIKIHRKDYDLTFEIEKEIEQTIQEDSPTACCILKIVFSLKKI